MPTSGCRKPVRFDLTVPEHAATASSNPVTGALPIVGSGAHTCRAPLHLPVTWAARRR